MSITTNILGSQVVSRTVVDVSPYVVVQGDFVLGVDTSALAIRIDLPPAGDFLGRLLLIVDETGGAGTRNITLNPNGAELINGAATFVISINRASAEIYSDGVGWHVTGDMAGGVFGQDYQSTEVPARTTTASLTFVVKASLVTPALTGTYRVGWMYVMDADDSSNSIEGRVFNVTDAAILGATPYIEEMDVGNVTGRRFVAGSEEVVFAGATKTIEIQFRTQDASTIAGIQGARLELWRVS